MSKAAKKRNKQRAKAAANKPQPVVDEEQVSPRASDAAPEPAVPEPAEDAGEGWNVRKSKGSKTSERCRRFVRPRPDLDFHCVRPQQAAERAGRHRR